MFQNRDLKNLQAQKDLLVLQSDANRLLLVTEWERLRTPETWTNEVGNLARRHPLWTTALTAVAGVLAVQTVRKTGSSLGGMARLGKLAVTALSVWKLFHGEKSTE